jgi:hypothetical protein
MANAFDALLAYFFDGLVGPALPEKMFEFRRLIKKSLKKCAHTL